MLRFFNRKQPLQKALVASLYASVTCHSRQLLFFQNYQVPDTPHGRFEMLALHLALLLRRLKFPLPEDPKSLDELTQSLCNWVVADIEESLRAMPVSDLKITRHLKSFIEGFYGRLLAYDKALELSDRDMLKEAIRRNVYDSVNKIKEDIAKELASYTQKTWNWLLETPVLQIIEVWKGEL